MVPEFTISQGWVGLEGTKVAVEVRVVASSAWEQIEETLAIKVIDAAKKIVDPAGIVLGAHQTTASGADVRTNSLILCFFRL